MSNPQTVSIYQSIYSYSDCIFYDLYVRGDFIWTIQPNKSISTHLQACYELTLNFSICKKEILVAKWKIYFNTFKVLNDKYFTDSFHYTSISPYTVIIRASKTLISFKLSTLMPKSLLAIGVSRFFFSATEMITRVVLTLEGAIIPNGEFKTRSSYQFYDPYAYPIRPIRRRSRSILRAARLADKVMKKNYNAKVDFRTTKRVRHQCFRPLSSPSLPRRNPTFQNIAFHPVIHSRLHPTLSPLLPPFSHVLLIYPRRESFNAPTQNTVIDLHH